MCVGTAVGFNFRLSWVVAFLDGSLLSWPGWKSSSSKWTWGSTPSCERSRKNAPTRPYGCWWSTASTDLGQPTLSPSTFLLLFEEQRGTQQCWGIPRLTERSLSIEEARVTSVPSTTIERKKLGAVFEHQLGLRAVFADDVMITKCERPVHHCHKSRPGLSCTVIVSWAHRWHSQTKSKARDEPNSDRGPVCWRPDPKCSDNIWLHQDVQEQVPDFFFVSFYSASCLSLGLLVQRCLGQPWPSAALIPRQLSTAVHFQSVEHSRVQRNLEGLANVRLDELTVVRRRLTFFFLMLTRRRRGLGERGDKILRWRHSNCTHCDACRRETAWMFPETLRSASRKTERPFQAHSGSHRTD